VGRQSSWRADRHDGVDVARSNHFFRNGREAINVAGGVPKIEAEIVSLDITKLAHLRAVGSHLRGDGDR
jgi:hypothetical protein